MADTVDYVIVDNQQKKINYETLANLPTLQPVLSDTDGAYGQRIKAIEDVLADAIDFEAQTY